MTPPTYTHTHTHTHTHKHTHTHTHIHIHTHTHSSVGASDREVVREAVLTIRAGCECVHAHE